MSEKRIVCIVQARMGSHRLPGKSLRELAGRPLLAHVLQRAKAIKGIDAVVLATTDETMDDPVEALGNLCSIPVTRGSAWDVLDRFRMTAMRHKADHVLRITGDCPFLAPEVAEEVLEAYASSPLPVHYISNDTESSGFPDGTDVEVFSWELLDEASRRATGRPDREHVTSWMRRTTTWGAVQAPKGTDWARWKLSVDTMDDYLRARAIADMLPDGDYSLRATLAAATAAMESPL